MPRHPGDPTTAADDPGRGGNPQAPVTSLDELPEQFDPFSRDAKQAALDALNGCRRGAGGGEDCMRLAMQAARDAEGGGQAGPQGPERAGPRQREPRRA